MVPPQSKAGFAFQISTVTDPYNPTAALAIINQDHNLALFSFLKEPESVSCRLFGSSGGDRPSSAPNSLLAMPRSGVDNNTHHQQPAQMPTFGGTQVSYGSLKKLTEGEGSTSTSESHSPSLRGPRYYSPALTEPSASNREDLSGFQGPGYEHLTYSGSDHSFHSASTSSSGSGNFHTGIRLETNSQLPHAHQYQQGRRHVDAELYGQQNSVKLEKPIKIECSHVMSSSTWVYPTTQQLLNYHDTTQGTASSQPQITPQSPGLGKSVVHLALLGQNGTPPENATSRSHSPSCYNFPSSAPTVLQGDHRSIYGGGSLSLSVPASSFPDPDPNVTSQTSTSDSTHHSLDEESFSAPRGPLSAPITSIHMGHYNSLYLDRPQDIQLLHCSQCTQRFPSHEHFAKHQIKHQKLHRCRIKGCSRVEGFTTPNDRDRHEKSVHKTPGMYFRCMDRSCASYMKTFARRDNLKDHLKRMHKMPQEMDDMEANERRNELADSWRVDLTPGLTPPPGV